ncbi:MAG: lipid-A-disaccharide synthase N-terminal domain-containing protein [Verrucomicrobiota bacterium]
MDWGGILAVVWVDGRFLGIEWHAWKVVGWVGNLIFFSRFLVQWYATERRRKVVVPQAFWWLSLTGSLILLSYAIQRRDSVFIAGQAFSWIPYLRNLWIHRKHHSARRSCPTCEAVQPAEYRHCPDCGARLLEDAGAGSVLAQSR